MSDLTIAPSDAIYGLLAEFDSKERLQAAAEQLLRAGFVKIEAFSPFRIEALPDELTPDNEWLIPLLCLIGGILGAVGTFGLQYYGAVIDYPLNVGGRPLDSWPAYLVSAIVISGLGVAIFAVIGFFWVCRFPQPYHPLFKVPQFRQGSVDRFFCCVTADDPQFDRVTTYRFLRALDPLSIAVVEV